MLTVFPVTGIAYRLLASGLVLGSAYVFAKLFAKVLDRFGPDARAGQDRYADNANRERVRSRMPYRRDPAIEQRVGEPLHAGVDEVFSSHASDTAHVEELISETKTRPHAT